MTSYSLLPNPENPVDAEVVVEPNRLAVLFAAVPVDPKLNPVAAAVVVVAPPRLNGCTFAVLAEETALLKNSCNTINKKIHQFN